MSKLIVHESKQFMPKLAQMEIFYYVATWKSFSKAALELGISKGYVSTQITKLEQTLGVQLLQRTTRHLSLTEEGNLLLESCMKIVREKQAAISLLKGAVGEPAGQLKITAPPSMCDTFLVDLLPKFQEKYPKIALSVDSSSAVKNLLQYDMDIALRITKLPDANSIARLITHFRFAVCATPAYLRQCKNLKKPEDLGRFNCLVYAADPAQNLWPFQVKNATKMVTVQGNLASTSSTIIKSALLANHWTLDKNCFM